MAVNQNAEFLPKSGYLGAESAAQLYLDKQHQKRKWRLFFAVFVIVLLGLNLLNWLRPAEYQSQAILQISAANQMTEKNPDQWAQNVELHLQRMVSESVVAKLAFNLQQAGLTTNVAQLRQILNVAGNVNGNVIVAEARGHDADVLQHILQSWIDDYLASLDNEYRNQSSDELQLKQQQLQELEARINLQRQQLDEFAQQHEIISLERDENQILTKIKSLSSELDASEAEKTQLTVALEKLQQLTLSGERVINPADKASIADISAKLNVVQQELKALRERYTEEYIARDPLLVAKQRAEQELSAQLAQQSAESQQNYQRELMNGLDLVTTRTELIQQQLSEQRSVAQKFNQQLQQYKRLDAELNDLQQQKIRIQNQLVELELANPVATKINVLEGASPVSFPVGPDYWLDSLYSAGAALLTALLSLMIYLIVTQSKKAPQSTPNIVIVPQYSAPADNLLQASQARIPVQAETHHIEALSAPAIRTLNIEQCQHLFAHANKTGKIVISLLVSGLDTDELIKLNMSQFSAQFKLLTVGGAYSRSLQLSDEAGELLTDYCQHKQGAEIIWPAGFNSSALSQLVVNAAIDAELPNPHGITPAVVRLSYIQYLLEQGIKLGQLEAICGYVDPGLIAQVKESCSNGLAAGEQISLLYPLSAKV